MSFALGKFEVTFDAYDAYATATGWELADHQYRMPTVGYCGVR
jgi:hypothetical protein